MGAQDHRHAISSILNGLRTGKTVEVKLVGDKKILRITWLNIIHDPQVFSAIAKAIAEDVKQRGYVFDAVASVETSGAKYGVALSYQLNKPYFSIHKAGKIIFDEPVSMDQRSVTENRAVTLYVDRAVASRFRKVLLVDDIRRSSKTLETAAELLAKCGVEVEACYVILDLAFAGHPPPSNIPSDRYHALFVIEDVDDEGRCRVVDGLAVNLVDGWEQSSATKSETQAI